MAECCADVMLAHNPPLCTAHNTTQPELSVLYQNLLAITKKQQSPLSVRRYNTRTYSPTREDGAAVRQTAQANPRRPCLVIRADSDASIGSSSSSSSDENEPISPMRTKKKVVFADDRGLSLTQVRLMNEPSNQPPKLMTVGLYLNPQPAGVVGSGAVVKQGDQHWKVRFSQPASSYLDFRKRLDVGNISLENVIVKSPDHRIMGTVKVRNLSYDKEVFVRCTQDKWTTHQDTQCSYVQNNAMMNMAPNGSCSASSGSMQNVTAIYDTFSFHLPLPINATSMEFAVCYKSDAFECWDNNDGCNYCLSTGADQPACPLLLQQPLTQQLHSAAPAPPSPLSPSILAEYDHQPVSTKQPVHYFGAQSRQNSWSAWRDQKIDTSTYW